MPVERKLAKVVTKKVGKKDIKKDKKTEVRSNNTNVDNPKKGNSFLVIGIILISIAVILVILSLVYFNRSSRFAKIIKITNSNEIVSMYNDSKSITCYMTYSSGDEQGTSEMYVKKGMISQRTETTIDGEEFEMYALAKNDKLYTWGNVYDDGEGYYMTYEVDIKEELQLFDDADSGTIVNCKKGVDDNSVFKLPKNIKFELLDDYLDESDEEINDKGTCESKGGTWYEENEICILPN